jgi:asparagine synthase (glutamine-hydrolysing)
VFGGYLYFHKAPDAREFHEETIRKLDALHNYDCLRANKSMMAWGVEPRVPFLDREFLDVAMRMDARFKMAGVDAQGARRIEKAILREAFTGYLPDSILWRQKEQFSDGVGYGWIDGLKAHAQAQVSDRVFAAAASRFPGQPAAGQGGLPVPAHLRAVLPGRGLRADGARRQVDRVFLTGRDRVGRGVRGDGGSLGTGGGGSTPGRIGVASGPWAPTAGSAARR